MVIKNIGDFEGDEFDRKQGGTCTEFHVAKFDKSVPKIAHENNVPV
jgi:hypothetical protein